MANCRQRRVKPGREAKPLSTSLALPESRLSSRIIKEFCPGHIGSAQLTPAMPPWGDRLPVKPEAFHRPQRGWLLLQAEIAEKIDDCLILLVSAVNALRCGVEIQCASPPQYADTAR